MQLTSQAELISVFCAKPEKFAWFLGAGTSRSAGLPTASDIIWDLKRRYYCREENQDISRQDIQNEAVRARIQSFMDARGYPRLWADNEYSTYFEKIFGSDKERQRQYIKAMLSEDRVSLSVGCRVLGALLSSSLSRAVFTTNFDSVVEKAVAEVAGKSLTAYHLEGARAANSALNNEEFPLYCKLHGDFRFDSLKNLSDDLASQNEDLSICLVNASTRFGFVVAGYSGRDESVMELFRRALETENPFPHGLFWTGLKGDDVPPGVEHLLLDAQAKGIEAKYVEIETFDALMLRLWRNIEDKPAALDAKVRKTGAASVSLPLPAAGRGKPLLRFNALPVIETPSRCLSLSFKEPKEWGDLRRARNNSEGRVLFTKADTVWCWGNTKLIKEAFGDDLVSTCERDVPLDIRDAGNLHVKGFLEEALCVAIARDRPLLSRANRTGAHIIVDPHSDDKGALEPLTGVVGKTSGIIPGLLSAETEEHPEREQVCWSEAARISLELRGGSPWLLLDPDIWIWPPRSRPDATEFLDQRRSDRYNKKFNALLGAWARLVLRTDERGEAICLAAFDGVTGAENPAFLIGRRTAFSRKLVA